MRLVLLCCLASYAVACSADPGPLPASQTVDASIQTDAAAQADAAPTCTDGVANGGETGPDCGGPCAPCAIGLGCAAPADCATGLCRQGVCTPPGWLLGPDGAAKLVTLLDKKLAEPMALAFNPAQPDQLWIANRKDGSLTVLATASGKVERYVDQSLHFLEKAVALSFSDNGTFGTCGDTRNDYSGLAEANDFMGPVLWPATLDDFHQHGPDASKVHLDMMHDTPSCMGIAAAGANTYFAFNGLLGTIDWYDFAVPHPHGDDDHSDGAKRRYKGLGLERVAGVPSHLAYDAASGWLYVADTGNGRVVRLDPKSGKVVGKIQLYANEVKNEVVASATLEVVVDGLGQPSGLVLYEGFLYVSEADTGVVYAFGLDGKLANMKDTGLGPDALAGLAVGPDDRLYLVDRKSSRILRFER